MNILTVLLASIGLSIHVFHTTLKIGATQVNLKNTKTTLMGLIFGLVQILMLILGIVLSLIIEDLTSMTIISEIYKYLAFAFLFVLGFKMLHSVFSEINFEEKRQEAISLKICTIIAIRTSLEAFIVGMGIYYFNPDTIYDILCVLVCSTLAAILGLWYGYWNGFYYSKKLCLLGGILLSVTAFKIIL